MRIVHKYGGTSLGDDARMERAARHVAFLAKEGHQMIVVVSAQGDTTDALLADTAQANPRERMPISRWENCSAPERWQWRWRKRAAGL